MKVFMRPINLLSMLLGMAKVGSERRVVIVRDHSFLSLPQDGIEAVLSDMKNFLAAFKLLRLDSLVEVNVEKLLAPLTPRKIFLPAVNFRSHSKESSTKPPEEPYFFTKFPNAIIGPEEEIILPQGSSRVDYEGEIGIVIGKKGKYIPRERAMDYVFGYTIVNDVSIRDMQYPERHPYGLNWVLGKGVDTALPMGPWIATKEEVKWPAKIITKVNGEIRQEGITDDMIFGPEELISYVSRGITLEPGDIITTGTPSGVAEFSGNRYLAEGDVVEVSVDGIGTLRNRVKREQRQ